MTTMNSAYHSSSGIQPRSGERYPSPTNTVDTDTIQGRQNHSVDFRSRGDDYQEERKKYLTAKYPQHQMRLIRKRLQVEDWVDTQLKELYDVVDETDTYDCEIDLDELLDLDKLSERRKFIQERIANVRKSPQVINSFIEDLLEKVSTL